MQREDSFLRNAYLKNLDIDEEGKITDRFYDYNKEMKNKKSEVALEKIMLGLTGKKMPIPKDPSFCSSLRHEIKSATAQELLQSVFHVLDMTHAMDLEYHKFYVKPGIRHIRNMQGLKMLHIDEVILPNGVTSIERRAFHNAGIKRIRIPNTVSVIGEEAFLSCGLTGVVLSKNRYLKELGGRCFVGNQLKNVIIPDNILALDTTAFLHNPDLFEIEVGEKTRVIHENKTIKRRRKNLYGEDKNSKGNTVPD